MIYPLRAYIVLKNRKNIMRTKEIVTTSATILGLVAAYAIIFSIEAAKAGL